MTQISILDLAFVAEGGSPAESFRASVRTAQAAERLGYTRYWFAEHHNMLSIASSAPAVLIAHIAAHTQKIRVGSGGIMLPNHSPLLIAEQFGTLEALYPGRIDLGVGRAPGGDQETFAALRRDPRAAEHFPEDVHELQMLFGPLRHGQTIQAIPGTGLRVPLYILGSSLFGAQLAAHFGLPFAFASHFAPDALEAALEIYRENFRPSEQCERPHVIAGLNVIAADRTDEALRLYEDSLRRISLSLAKRVGLDLAAASREQLLASSAGRQARHMLTYTARGDREGVRREVEGFLSLTRADELMIVTNLVDTEARLQSYAILAEVLQTIECCISKDARRETSEHRSGRLGP